MTTPTVDIRVNGQRVVTTAQAVALSGGRWNSAAYLRTWIARNDIAPAGTIEGRVRVYYPADLGIELDDNPTTPEGT